MIPGSFPIIAGKPAVTAVFTDNANNPNTVDQFSHTYSSLSIGAATAERTVIVAAYSDIVSGCTIAGNAMTQLAASDDSRMKFYGLAYPTGTTATFVVTNVSGTNVDSFTVWAVYNLSSLTLVDFAAPTSANGTSATLSVDTQIGGAVLGASHINTIDQVATTYSWSGLTENHDTSFWRDRYSGASASAVAAATPRAITVTCSKTAFLTSLAISLR